MSESTRLKSARQHLTLAEARYRSADGLFHLDEALSLLEEVVASDSAEHATVARNLAATYAARIHGTVRERLQTDRAVPEPELEHLFKVVLLFDQRGFELPAESRANKIDLVRLLIDRYYEGRPAAEKQAMLDELTKIAQPR